MFRYSRTAVYLLAASLIWFAEDYVFTRAFGFNAAQTAVATLYFVALFVVAVLLGIRTYRQAPAAGSSPGDLPLARLVAYVPVLAVLLGSFLALPVLIFILIAGHL